eukprot:c4611_g1_i1.p1 GENE.c4611_g1_i1~~c4611_g1_i1.p1  ORF type:complete len:406 (+),score=100.59 c4611_g1_i1:43-1218(+)
MTSSCLSCAAVFGSAAEQKDHYHSEWHRHNLKRKVANLLPLSEAAFNERVTALTAQQQNQPQSRRHECAICRKSFHSDKAYEQHINSKKHREREGESDSTRRDTQNAEGKDLVIAPGLSEPMTEEEMEAEMQRKLELCEKRPNTLCLFCNKPSESLEGNLQHMAVAHGLFIPDVEYLHDVDGLVTYLKEKLCVGHVCLWCNGKGRSFQSLESVQGHMLDKSHCRIMYEEPEDWDEFADFYNYAHRVTEPEEDDSGSELSEGWEEDADQSNMEGVAVAHKPKPQIDMGETEGFQLVLADGRRVGHRSLKTFYKQKLRPQEQRSAVVTALLESYKRMDLTVATHLGAFDSRRDKILKWSQLHQQRTQSKWNERVGIIGNRTTRHHFVDRTMFC